MNSVGIVTLMILFIKARNTKAGGVVAVVFQIVKQNKKTQQKSDHDGRIK